MVITMQSRDGWVYIEVEDNGRGMAGQGSTLRVVLPAFSESEPSGMERSA
jgi:hypothetical protein